VVVLNRVVVAIGHPLTDFVAAVCVLVAHVHRTEQLLRFPSVARPSLEDIHVATRHLQLPPPLVFSRTVFVGKFLCCIVRMVETLLKWTRER
jgi:hypothetical protein